MKPVVLIHGYSAEGRRDDIGSITSIYGDLPQRLRTVFRVVEVDLSRYVSLDDAVTIQDIARGLNRALLEEHAKLLEEGFHVIIHSTGALVIRKWIQLFSRTPSPIRNLIYLAGANLGSGWALVGQGQRARWYRRIVGLGAERGLKILQALEPGSSATIDMHLRFTEFGTEMWDRYEVQEFVMIGSHPDPAWISQPIRYSHEDGSDGVVRVSATNLNFNHIVIAPKAKSATLSWGEIREAAQAVEDETKCPEYYELNKKETSYAGVSHRLTIPFGIVYGCAHSGQTGIVSGSGPRQQVERMLGVALNTPERSRVDWQNVVAAFEQETRQTFEQVKNMPVRRFRIKYDPRKNYDPHSQLIFRLWDQDGAPIPVSNADIYFASNDENPEKMPIKDLIEHTVSSHVTSNVKVFYLRVAEFVAAKKDWTDRLSQTQDFDIEITAVEPATPIDDPLVSYLPLRFPVRADEIHNFIQPHRTTIVDVTLLRLPSPQVYRLVQLP